MGTYKVIQDIEAEDKLLGPLSLRQFIYAVVVIVLGFVSFQLAKVSIILVIPFLPPMIFFAALAAPISKDQSTEVWLLSRIRFFLKPRRRIWDQSGIKELVTITAPKKIEKALTKDLSQVEVKSRLEALANTIDSRGWAVKNVNVNMFAQPSYVLGQVDSDRLIDPSLMANDVPAVDISASEDILDTQNTRAQALDQMIATSSKTHKQEVVQNMKNPKSSQQTQPADYWFLNQTPGQPARPGMATFSKSSVVQPGQQSASTQKADTSGPDEQALLDKIHAEKARPNPGNSHLKTLRPIEDQKIEQPAQTLPSNPEISNLANNNDLNIETIARQANKKPEKHGDDEVVISLR
jgi:hypothetical protein